MGRIGLRKGGWKDEDKGDGDKEGRLEGWG